MASSTANRSLLLPATYLTRVGSVETLWKGTRLVLSGARQGLESDGRCTQAPMKKPRVLPRPMRLHMRDRIFLRTALHSASQACYKNYKSVSEEVYEYSFSCT